MKKGMPLLIIIISASLILAVPASATPSTQIWNPSTDIRPTGSLHIDIDNYFTLAGPANGGTLYPTDYGLTYGLMQGVEMGIDAFTPAASEYTLYTFNAKYGIPENGDLPAFAIGGMNLGFNTDRDNKSSDQNIFYGLAAKTFNFGRLTAGYYSGNEHVLVNSKGDISNTGFIFTWDKNLSDKLWLSIDYASGFSSYGSMFCGLSWLFSPNTSVILGYGAFNDSDISKPVVTTQLDINI
jgi:hypothetical protein